MTVKFQKNAQGKILFDRLRELFTKNHTCPRFARWEDKDILAIISDEFGPLPSDRNYVSIWRDLFNKGQMHLSIPDTRDFVAYRVNMNKQFTKSTSQKKGLTFQQLYDDYNKQGFKIPKALAKEVEGYKDE